MRLFVAADVPHDLREMIESSVVAPLRERLSAARFTHPEGRHLTLKFLGNVGDERLDEIRHALAIATGGHAPFDASFTEIGGFPNLRRPRVLWIGIGDGSEQLAAIARSLDGALEPAGFVPESRPFLCHLTLARFRDPRTVQVPELTVPGAPFRVREIVLLRSHLHPKGARYEALDRFGLSG